MIWQQNSYYMNYRTIVLQRLCQMCVSVWVSVLFILTIAPYKVFIPDFVSAQQCCKDFGPCVCGYPCLFLLNTAPEPNSTSHVPQPPSNKQHIPCRVFSQFYTVCIVSLVKIQKIHVLHGLVIGKLPSLLCPFAEICINSLY